MQPCELCRLHRATDVNSSSPGYPFLSQKNSGSLTSSCRALDRASLVSDTRPDATASCTPTPQFSLSYNNNWNLDYKARLKIICLLKKPGLLSVEGCELLAIFGEESCHCHCWWCWIIRTDILRLHWPLQTWLILCFWMKASHWVSAPDFPILLMELPGTWLGACEGDNFWHTS